MIGGASAPHPSASTFPLCWVLDLDPAKGLKPPTPPDLVGLKAGLEATGGAGPEDGVEAALLEEYFAPEASATFFTMPSGVRSRSDRAVIWTW